MFITRTERVISRGQCPILQTVPLKAWSDQIREQGIEGRYNWRGSPTHMIIYALQTGTPFVLEIFVWCTITVYTITFSEYFIYKWSTRLQSMYNQMVGRTASVISPFYSLLPGSNTNYKLNIRVFINVLKLLFSVEFSLQK